MEEPGSVAIVRIVFLLGFVFPVCVKGAELIQHCEVSVVQLGLHRAQEAPCFPTPVSATVFNFANALARGGLPALSSVSASSIRSTSSIIEFKERLRKANNAPLRL